MKRILSVILSLCMVASLFAGLGLNVSAATQEVQVTENIAKGVVNHYTNDAMASVEGVQSLVTGGDITSGSKIINAGLDDSQYTATSYVGTTPTKLSEDVAMKNYAHNPYEKTYGNDVDINAGALSRKDATETEKGTACNAVIEGRDNTGYFQLYRSVDGETTNFGIERLDIANTDENARGKAVLEYNLGVGNVVTDIVFGWSTSKEYRAGYYVVLTSLDGKNYTEQYRYIADKIGQNTAIQHVKFSNPVFANYVQVHFYSACNSIEKTKFKEMVNNNSVIRLRALQIYGNKTYTYDDHDTYSTLTTDILTAGELSEKYAKEVVGTKKGSLISKMINPSVTYFVSTEGAKGTSFETADGKLNPAFTYGTPTKLTAAQTANTISNFTDGKLFDGDIAIGNRDDAAGKVIRRMFIKLNMLTDDSKTVAKTDLIDDETKQWIQLDYELESEATISSLALVGKTKAQYNASHYKYYVSETADGLYKEENCVAEIGTAAAIGSVTLTTPKKAKYVGIRFICLHNTEINPGLGLVSLYSRATEFSVFGSYVNAADANVTYTVVGGAPETVVTKAEPSYTGLVDQNGNYHTGSVTLTAQEEYLEIVDNGKVPYDFDGWYVNGELYSADTTITYDLTKDDIQFTANYIQGARLCSIDFIDGTGKVIDTLNLEEGTVITPEMMVDINKKVEDVYGYEIVLNENNLVAWSDGVYGLTVTGSITYYAQYRNLGYQTAVTVTNVDGTKAYNQKVAFDTAITVTDDAAAAWEMDGAVVATGTELKLYAAGTTMNVTATAEPKPANELAFVGKAMQDGNFTVFVHANPTKTVKAYGVIFGSNTYKNNYDAQDDDVKATMFVLDDKAAFEKTAIKKPSLTDIRSNVTNVANVDFMTSLIDVPTYADGTYKARHARAYVIYSDDTVVYSDVIISNK